MTSTHTTSKVGKEGLIIQKKNEICHFPGPELTISKAYLGQYSHLATPIFIEFLQ